MLSVCSCVSVIDSVQLLCSFKSTVQRRGHKEVHLRSPIVISIYLLYPAFYAYFIFLTWSPRSVHPLHKINYDCNQNKPAPYTSPQQLPLCSQYCQTDPLRWPDWFKSLKKKASKEWGSSSPDLSLGCVGKRVCKEANCLADLPSILPDCLVSRSCLRC